MSIVSGIPVDRGGEAVKQFLPSAAPDGTDYLKASLGRVPGRSNLNPTASDQRSSVVIGGSSRDVPCVKLPRKIY
jgi:hypothetical protein